MAVLTLAIGIGSNTAVFSIANGVLLKALPYANPDRLVTLWETSGSGDDRLLVSAPNFLDWKNESHTLDEAGAFRPWGFTLTGGAEPRGVQGARASASLFRLLGVKPVIGRLFNRDEDVFGSQRVALLGEAFWELRFGSNKEVVGQSITLNGEAYTVVGVLPREFKLPEADLWVPLALEPYTLTQRGNRALTVVGRLKDGTTVRTAEADVRAIADRLQPQTAGAADAGVAVVPLQEFFVGRVKPTLILIWCAVGLVMLIACANVGNLALARSSARRHEMAVRATLGASRWTLLAQSATENVLLGVIGGAAGFVLARFAVAAFIANAPAGFPRLSDIDLDLVVLAYTLIMSVLAGLTVGLIPILGVTTGATEILSQDSRSSAGGRSSSRVRNVAIAAQAALAVIVLTGAGLLGRSLVHVLGVEPGFEPRQVLTISISPPSSRYADDQRRSRYYEQLTQQVRALPDVTGAGLISHLPLTSRRLAAGVSLAGDATTEGQSLSADYIAASGGTFEALGIQVVRGRTFNEQDALGGSPVVLVNETLARRLLPSVDPLGRRVIVGVSLGANPAPREIVGVVSDVRAAGLEAAAPPAVYIPSTQNPWPTLTMVVRLSGSAEAAVPAWRASLRGLLDRDQTVPEPRPLSAAVARTLAPRQFDLTLVSLYALIALVLASTGVYAVVAYSVKLRTREIGVRLALGARSSSVIALAIHDVTRWAGIGIVSGALVAAALSRLIAGMLFGVAPTDPLTFIVVLSGTTMVMIGAGALAALRAARLNPVTALRES